MNLAMTDSSLEKEAEREAVNSPSRRSFPTATNSIADKSKKKPLASVHTSNFPQILAHLNSSLVVSTYQAHKLIMLRNENGILNTHFRMFNKPMGMAVDAGRLAIGTAASVQEYHDVPAVANRLKGEKNHDAVFLPRRENITGDIQIHEMAYVNEPATGSAPPELWFVNTAFSCLAVRSNEYSFEPRWRPKFISQLAPEDRCHLNGLAVRDGRVKYVTALGKSDHAGGWRNNKSSGGILIDVESNEIIATGLSMPHSPRWYNDRLWILNSGTGEFGFVDLENGRYEELAQFNGFTRGLCFAGPLAFIGLSQVRESAVFSGIPLINRLTTDEQRQCGVWIVNIVSGETVGFVKFENAVQEIFGVELLAGRQFPELIQEDIQLMASSYVLPDDSLKDVPADLRSDVTQIKNQN